MKVYHGTSYDNYINYMKKGIIPDIKNWNQSNSNHIYFYSDKDKYSLEDAYYSSVKCAAIHNSQYEKVVILIGEIDDNLLIPDNSDGMTDFENNRFYIDKSDFNIKDFKLIFFKYRPNERAKYLYNQYHNTCATRWDDIKDYVHELDYVEKECDKIYKDINEYEYSFNEIRYENNILDWRINMKKIINKIKNNIISNINYEENDIRSEEEKTLSSMKCAAMIIVLDLLVVGLSAAVIIVNILR